jgi:hypothetical protein
MRTRYWRVDLDQLLNEMWFYRSSMSLNIVEVCVIYLCAMRSLAEKR